MTTPSQAAFEASLLGLYPKWDVRIAFAKRPDGEYASMSTHIGWLSWQAAEAHGRKQALEAVRKDAAWQPMETAPKDGTVILVYRNLEQGYEKRVCGTDYFKEGSWWLSRAEMQPTHWMPLPKPPIAIKELLK